MASIEQKEIPNIETPEIQITNEQELQEDLKTIESVERTEETEDPSYIEDPRTIFTDPDNFNIKHPLHNAWTFWYDSPSKKKSIASWSQNLKNIITIDTVEDFWGVFNNITKASELANGANYHLFREGIKPEWEDVANQKGGKWVFQSKKGKHDIDSLWLYTLLASIGETLDADNELNGCIFSARREFSRISLWTRSSDNADLALAIGSRFKETLGLKNEVIEFSAHSDSAPRFNTKNGKLTL